MSRIVPVDADHPDEAVVARASDVIRKGGLIVYPTETVYGIGADGTNPAAIRKVQQAKQRRENKPILVIVNSVEMLAPLVVTIPDAAKLLMDRFWPGPLTLVFKASATVSAELTLGSGTIGIRIPSSAFCLKLLATAGVPLTSTSANLSGEPSARSIGQIEKQLTGIDMFLDAGELQESQPSTVVDVAVATPRVLREGAVAFESLRDVVPDIQHFD